ncbi:unnamed protein product [Clonostachys solani]|uniref:Uncharacterized protein n=1 Tax=Clonostachys solani TaxID=160281 RepID=A0A9N9YYV3_9HYPO|nr:unnamed protein product [Clonostachys solani]
MENLFYKGAQLMRTTLETLKEREQILLQARADRPGSERVVAMITKLFEKMDRQTEMLVPSKLETGKDGFPNKRQRTEREGPLETESKNANFALDSSEETSLKQKNQDLSTTLDGMKSTIYEYLATTKKHLETGNVEGMVHAFTSFPTELCQWIKDDGRLECYSDDKMKEWVTRFNGQARQGAEQIQPR